jgi:hypothetical protein
MSFGSTRRRRINFILLEPRFKSSKYWSIPPVYNAAQPRTLSASGGLDQNPIFEMASRLNVVTWIEKLPSQLSPSRHTRYTENPDYCLSDIPDIQKIRLF